MSLNGKVRFENVGYAALNKRKEYFLKGESEYVKGIVANKPWELAKAQFENAEKLSDNFIEHLFVTLNENVNAAGDVVYINPFVAGSGFETNPFTTEKREYPVDYGNAVEDVLSFKLTIPEGYALEEKPENKVLALPQNAGKFLYNVSVNGNVIQVTSIVAINKSLFTSEEYPALREFYNHIVAKQAEQIVLKKI
jgi:hypothetical protein